MSKSRITYPIRYYLSIKQLQITILGTTKFKWKWNEQVYDYDEDVYNSAYIFKPNAFSNCAPVVHKSNEHTGKKMICRGIF